MSGWIRRGGRYFRPHKAVRDADFQSRSVLTDNPFAYVRMWLTRGHQKDAGYYWQQAENLFHSASYIDPSSSPLLYYYSFLNAAKCLLSVKEQHFERGHGLQSIRDEVDTKLDGVSAKLARSGVAVSLKEYLDDKETQTEFILRDLIGNLACVHRAFALTYGSGKEKFLPVDRPVFVHDDASSEMFLTMSPAHGVVIEEFKGRIPDSLRECSDQLGNTHIESSLRFPSKSIYLEDCDFEKLAEINKSVRKQLVYIMGPYDPWYVATVTEYDLDLSQMLIIFIVMHRLSEMSRYEPLQLRSLLGGQENWLISEFLDRAPRQFIDEIACQLTGHQIQIPGVRQPKSS